MEPIMKKIFAFGLMAALVCGISMSIASCKDDNDSKSEEQQAEEQKAQATKALKMRARPSNPSSARSRRTTR